MQSRAHIWHSNLSNQPYKLVWIDPFLVLYTSLFLFSFQALIWIMRQGVNCRSHGAPYLPCYLFSAMRNWSHYCVRGTWFVIISLVLADWARGPRYCIRQAQATIGHHRLGHFTTSRCLFDEHWQRQKKNAWWWCNTSCWLDNINLHCLCYCQKRLGDDVPCAADVCVHYTIFMRKKKNKF